MTAKREVIAEGVVLSTTSDQPGRLCVTLYDDAGGFRLGHRVLTPEEVDKLVLSALSMTKPEDLGGYAEVDYQAAMDAVRVWQGTCALRGSVRQRDTERNVVMWEAGYRSLTYAKAGPAVQFLVDQLIEARKAGQK